MPPHRVRSAVGAGEERGDGARKRKHSPIPTFKPRERPAAKDAAVAKAPAARPEAASSVAKRAAPVESQAKVDMVINLFVSWRLFSSACNCPGIAVQQCRSAEGQAHRMMHAAQRRSTVSL